MQALVGVLMGSRSDWETMKNTAQTLDDLGVAHEVFVLSAHRTPDQVLEYADTAADRGLEVIVAAAGGAAHLAGVIAAKTILPVLGVPMESKALHGMDSLLSMVQMPAGIPVATLAIGKPGAINAALFATAILAIKRPSSPRRSRPSARTRPRRSSKTLTRVGRYSKNGTRITRIGRILADRNGRRGTARRFPSPPFFRSAPIRSIRVLRVPFLLNGLSDGFLLRPRHLRALPRQRPRRPACSGRNTWNACTTTPSASSASPAPTASRSAGRPATTSSTRPSTWKRTSSTTPCTSACASTPRRSRPTCCGPTPQIELKALAGRQPQRHSQRRPEARGPRAAPRTPGRRGARRPVPATARRTPSCGTRRRTSCSSARTAATVVDRLHALFEQTFGHGFEPLGAGRQMFRLAELRSRRAAWTTPARRRSCPACAVGGGLAAGRGQPRLPRQRVSALAVVHARRGVRHDRAGRRHARRR